MRTEPDSFPDKTVGEKVSIKFSLAGALGADTISEVPTFVSSPTGLTFANSALADSSQSITADVSEGTAGTTYVISALCTLASGSIYQPAARMTVVTAGSE